MTEYEIQQLQLSQQILDKLTGIDQRIMYLHDTVSSSVYELQTISGDSGKILDQAAHLSGQTDLMHQTVYTSAVYSSVSVGVLILCAALLMFLVGYKVSRGS